MATVPNHRAVVCFVSMDQMTPGHKKNNQLFNSFECQQSFILKNKRILSATPSIK